MPKNNIKTIRKDLNITFYFWLINMSLLLQRLSLFNLSKITSKLARKFL